MSRRTVAGLVLSAFMFAVLAILVALRWHPLVAFDDTVVRTAHVDVLGRPWLLAAATAVTDAGSPLAVNLVLAAVAAVLCAARRVRSAAYLVVARLLELGIETIVKYLLARPRPVLPDPVAHAGGFSFPSGHAAGTTVLYVALLALITRHRRATVILASLAVLLIAGVATSRVLLGVHYPSDVVGGVLLGLTCAFAAQPVRPPPNRPDARPTSHATAKG